MSRFVHIADLHAHVWSMFSQGDGLKNTRLQRSLAILDKSLSYAYQEGIPWTFGGDLVHTAGYALNTVLAGLTRVLSKYPDVEKLVVWGNHDARGIGGVIEFDQTVWAALANVPNLWVLNGNSYEAGGITFSGVGYQPHARLLQYPDPSDVGLYHQTVRGSQTASGFELEGVDPAEMLERHKLAIVGHIHHSQVLCNGKVFIPGSPEHHNFGDAGPHGWWVFQEDYGRTFMDGESPEFRVVDTVNDVQEDKHFYRVRTVAAGDVVPEGISVIAPTPTIIKQRDTLAGLEAGSEAILQTWMATNPPERGITVDQAFMVGRDLLTAHTPTQLTDYRLTELTLTNFCCFAQATVTVKPGICLITGKGRDYPSNGAGKSTLVGEALFWLLFGRTTKGLGAEDVIRRGTNSCAVTGVFVTPEGHGMRTLHVIRERGPKGHTLRVEQGDDAALGHVWEAASVNDMTTKLGTYLGITPEIFQNLAYFSQEKLVLFSAATDGDRKDVLADLLGLSAYQDAAVTAGTTLRLLKDERIALEARRDTRQETVERDQRAVTELRKARDAWTDAHSTRQLQAEEHYNIEQQTVLNTGVRVDRQRAHVLEFAKWLEQRALNRQPQRRKVLQAEAAATAATAAQDRVQWLMNEIETTKACILKNFPSLELARTTIGALMSHEEGLAQYREAVQRTSAAMTMCKEQVASALTLVSVTTIALQQATNALQEAEAATTTDECPTCGRTLDEEARQAIVNTKVAWVQQAKADSVTAEESYRSCCTILDTVGVYEFEQATAALVAAEKNVDQLHQVQGLLEAFDLKEATLRSDPGVVTQDEFIEERLSEELTQYRLFLNTRLRRAEIAGAARIRHRADILLRAEGERDRVRAEENLYEKTHAAALDDVLEAKAQVLIWDNDLAEKSIEAAIYTYWQHGFSKQGLQSLLVEEIAARFNQHRTRIFPVLTAGVYDVQFATRSRTGKGEWRERTEFVIHEHGKIVPYAGLSGGQRRRVDIGVLLTLISAVAEWMGTPGVFGVLVLDEVFEFLDGSGSEGLLGALDQIATRIPTIYVIDHGTHLQSVVPSILHVVQDATGTSAIIE